MKTVFLLCLLPLIGFSQTKTTVDLDKKYDGLSLYFYKNTLRMLNQKDDKEFDELIKDIEKMRFVMINKAKSKFEKQEYGRLKKNYQGEKYEEVMTGRFDGRQFDVLLREINGDVKGTVILASDSSSLYVLDILGKVALNKVSSLFKVLDNSTDIGGKVKDFMTGDEENQKRIKEAMEQVEEAKAEEKKAAKKKSNN
ncbi:MAG: DUF4252 domain-containing protein [Cyclobacteriaceae bacterium]|nr:DUF4252 domain-containing protein [Cyclobacteriaceae bacterium]